MNMTTAEMQTPLLGRLLRCVLFCCGALLTGLCIGVCSVTGYGADPITVFYEGVSATLGVTQGTASNLTAIGMVLLTLLIDRRQLGLGTILAPFILGYGIDLFLSLPLEPPGIAANILLLVAGLGGIALGIACQIVANFGRASYEGLTISICEKYNKSYVVVRWCLDGLLLLSGVLLGGRLTIATLVAALLLGKLIAFFLSTLRRLIPATVLGTQ